MPKAVAILEVMWDWEARTSSAGYAEQAPEYFRINGDNFTGRRLYWFLGHYDLLVTNACPELVSGPRQRGKPNKEWLRTNLADLWPFDTILVCGKVAQQTFELTSAPHPARIVMLPHPAARIWTAQSLNFAREIIQHGKQSVLLKFREKRLRAELLIPF